MREPRPSKGQRQAVRKAIEEGAVVDTAFLAMNGFAAVVASYGLLADSTAGVIGAMIIATLLGPITGLALALVDGNNRLLRNALVALGIGVGLVLAVALAVGWFHRSIPLTSEILARTKPNFLDLMIALAGGAAGAFAAVSPRVSAGLVGVAVSTALVPPLATAGLCLARGETVLASGGFLLFLANLVAIQLASSIVLFLTGYHEMVVKPSAGWTLLRRNIPSAVLLLVLGVALTLNLKKVLTEQGYRSRLQSSLVGALGPYPGVRLVDLWVEDGGGKTIVMAVVRTPYSFSPQRVKGIQDALPRLHDRPIELHLRAVLTKEATAEGYLHERKAQSEPDRAERPTTEPREPPEESLPAQATDIR